MEQVYKQQDNENGLYQRKYGNNLQQHNQYFFKKNHSVETAVTILDNINGFPSFQGEHLEILQRLLAQSRYVHLHFLTGCSETRF